MYIKRIKVSMVYKWGIEGRLEKTEKMSGRGAIRLESKELNSNSSLSSLFYFPEVTSSTSVYVLKF